MLCTSMASLLPTFLYKFPKRFFRIGEKLHWKVAVSACPTCPETKKTPGMTCHMDSGAGMSEFAGKECILPTRYRTRGQFLRNPHTSNTDTAVRVCVPVGSTLQACICCWAPIFAQGPHKQFCPDNHEHQGRVGIYSSV